MRRSVLLSAAAIGLLMATPARADDVVDAITEAQRAYQGGQFQAAQTALRQAVQLLSLRAAAGLAAALPDALPGWAAEDATSNADDLLAGSYASRKYHDAQGQTVEIQLMSDNPTIAQLGPMLRNMSGEAFEVRVMSDHPIIAQVGTILANWMVAGATGRLVSIGEQRAIQRNDGNIQMLVDDRILVQVQGDAPAEAKLAYARAIDVARLAGR